MILSDTELPSYFIPATNMTEADRMTYLARANAYCLGEIGGEPPILPWDTLFVNLKGIVAAAFEILVEGETAEVDQVSGNVTEAAPTRPGTAPNPLKNVDKMLLPYKNAYARENAEVSDYGFSFLGGR
ncbi:hypothetical protein [Paenibacillus sp. FSL R5-0908]|uniref:hypothetical protein n=1 Tax=Paenibacillus sp. FSL R5-0908 TaxID=2921664 RepID=UPI0030F68859